MIAIIASVEEELQYILSKTDITKQEGVGNALFYVGVLFDNDVVICSCKTGKVHAATKAQQIIDLYKPKLLINCGVAGGIGKNLNIGDVIIMTDTIQVDMDATGLGYKKGEIPDIRVTNFKPDKNFIETAKKITADYKFKYHLGRIISADKFVAGKTEQIALREEFDALCTDMETAAFAQACYINNVNFAGIRGISDTADESADDDFWENLIKASDNCAMILCDILREIKL